MKTTIMVSSLLLFYSVSLILAVAASVSPGERASKEFKVGGVVGWRQPATNETELYNRWAAERRFRVGDSLRFEYKNDSVVVVDKWGYYHCNTSNPISFFNDGNTTVDLDKPGSIYFVSGNSDRCKNGERFVAEVMSPHPVPNPPPSIAAPPQPFPGASPAPAPATPSSSDCSAAGTMVSQVIAAVAAIVMVSV